MSGFTFQMLGFRVNVQSGFGILAGIVLLFGLQAQSGLDFILGVIAVMFVSILIHELGHAVACAQFRLPVHGIFIHGFGGHVLHGLGTAKQQLLVSLAGPAAGLALGLPLLTLILFQPPDAGLLGDLLFSAVYINIVWSLFNLLPMLPLDGGNALSSGLEIAIGRSRGPVIAARVGIATGTGVAVLALISSSTWIMLIGGFCAYTSYQTLLRLQR